MTINIASIKEEMISTIGEVREDIEKLTEYLAILEERVKSLNDEEEETTIDAHDKWIKENQPNFKHIKLER